LVGSPRPDVTEPGGIGDTTKAELGHLLVAAGPMAGSNLR
jgi:hypothetical protein